MDPSYLESLRRRRSDGVRIISGMLEDETLDCRVYETMWAHYIETIPWSAMPHCLGCSLSTVKRLRRKGEMYVANALMSQLPCSDMGQGPIRSTWGHIGPPTRVRTLMRARQSPRGVIMGHI